MVINSIYLDDLKNKNIYIYGAGTYGIVTYKILNHRGIKIRGFIDANADMLKEVFGQKVFPIHDTQISEDNVILIASLNHASEMVAELNKREIATYYSIEEILRSSGDEDIFDEYEKEILLHLERYISKLNSISDGTLVISNIDLVVTEKCNLRCKDCGSLIPYYKNPMHIELDDIIRPFDKFINCIDKLLEVRLLGGETFLYPYLIELINHYVNNSKIERIIIFTNSTVLPKEDIITCMKNRKVFVHLSDYGDISKRIDDLEKLLIKNKIQYYRHAYQDWRNMGGLERRNYSQEELKKVFLKCDNKNCPSFYRGRIYVCPRAAHGERNGFFVNRTEEIVDFNVDFKNVLEKRKEIISFQNRSLFEACKYCSGNSMHDVPIKAAIQIKNEE